MKGSIQNKLFRSYSTLILSVIVIASVPFYFYFSHSLKEAAKNTLLAECNNITTQIETQLKHMDVLSKHIIVSKNLRQFFFQDLYSNTLESSVKRKEFTDQFFGAIDYDIGDLVFRFFDKEGRFVHISSQTIFRQNSGQKLPDWVTQIADSSGFKVILPPHRDDWENIPTNVVSLCRTFSRDNTLPHTAMLEIQCPASFLETMVAETLQTNAGNSQVYILDQNGTLLYPLETSKQSQLRQKVNHIYKAIQTGGNKDTLRMDSLLTGREQTSYVSRISEETGWTVVMEIPEKELMGPAIQFRNILLLSLGCILLLLLLISYTLARSLVIPLRKLDEVAARMDLRNLSSCEMPQYSSQYKELNHLYTSMSDMNQKLKNSLDEVVSLRSHEIQSKMLALQSQMNPHFLYNTLAIISAMAEEDCTEEVVDICEDLSSMLRYISSGNMALVRLEEEIDQTLAYLHLMKIKYEERLKFYFDIGDEMKELRVPKLMIQPLVENCIKYATDCVPPWILHIRGWMDGNRWYIQVSDNGKGFDAEQLEQLNRSLSDVVPEKDLPALEIHGMGLKNLYIRLRLTYGDEAVFRIHSSAGMGSEITIGGIDQEEENDVST